MFLRFLIIIGLLVHLGARAEDLDPKAKLLAAVEHVDRLVVMLSDMSPPDEHRSREDILFELNDRQKIADLIQQLDFVPEPDTYRQTCQCLGTHRLEFYSGDRYRFTLLYSHWEALRGNLGGPWFGDAVMSPEGSDAFVAWFAQNGFPEFREQKTQLNQWRIESETRHAQVAAYFPAKAQSWIPAFDHNNSWASEDKQHAADLASLYEDPSEFVLTVWRALGLLVSWSKERGGYLYGEPAGFLRTSLNKVSAHDIETTLTALQDDDTLAKLGAFVHCDSLGNDDTATIDEWPKDQPEQLAMYYLTHGVTVYPCNPVKFLSALSTDLAHTLLLGIGAQAQPQADAAPPSDDREFHLIPEPPAEIMALYYLAKIQYAEAKPVIESKLKNAPLGQDRLTLEIALAHYGDTEALGLQHLACAADRNEAAKFAWSILLSKTEPSSPAIDLLLAGTRSESYAVREDAEARLLKKGLRPAEKVKQQNVDVNTVVDRKLSGREAIDACTAALGSTNDSLTITALHVRRGLAYFEVGKYDAARLDFGKWRDGITEPDHFAYKLAISAFAVGRFDQAWELAAYNSRQGKDYARYMELLGSIYYALDDFATAADWFTASNVTAGYDESLIFRHLALLQLGTAQRSPLYNWEPDWIIEEDGWPDNLIRFLQGKLEEEAMLQSASLDSYRGISDKLCLAQWTLSQVARAKGDFAAERTHLEQCIEAKAYTSLSHAMALARLQEIKEDRAL